MSERSAWLGFKNKTEISRGLLCSACSGLHDCSVFDDGPASTLQHERRSADLDQRGHALQSRREVQAVQDGDNLLGLARQLGAGHRLL